MSNEIKPIAECKTLQELFADPKRWTQGAMAKDEQGKTTYICTNAAVCFCLAGGLSKVYPDGDARIVSVKKIRVEIGDMVDWNDDPKRSARDVQDLVAKLNI